MSTTRKSGAMPFAFANPWNLGRTAAILFLMLAGAGSAYAYDFASGTGQPNDPYQIATAGQLISIGADPNLLDKSFVLIADIDLDPNLPGRQIFTQAVIAPDTNDTPDTGVREFRGIAFNGQLDGDGRRIVNFTIGQTRLDYLGLFGMLGPQAQVSNLRFENVSVLGEETSAVVGALAGWNSGRITNCRVSGSVAGRACVGGLVGSNGQSGVIDGSRTTGAVLGEGFLTDTAGGLVGCNSGSIARSYADVNVLGGAAALGGLVGHNGGAIRACYAVGRVVGDEFLGGLVATNFGTISSSYAIVGIESKQLSVYLGGLVAYNVGLVVNSYAVGTLLNQYPEDSIMGGLIGVNGEPSPEQKGSARNCFWNTEPSDIHASEGGMGLTTAQMMDAEVYSLNGWASDPNWVLDAGNDYPRLAWEGTPGRPIPTPSIAWFDGEGTPEVPYTIATAEQLARIGTASILWDKAFRLAADVNLAGIDFPPIGCCPGTDFNGTFDGDGHVIHGLTIDTGSFPEMAWAGMFGYLGSGGLVQRLALREATITCGWGAGSVGILAGVNEGTISECSASGDVAAGGYANDIGGLAGHNTGRIENCYSTGSVSVGDRADFSGILAGYNAGVVNHCYAATSLFRDGRSEAVGGLVGSDRFRGQVSDSYFLVSSDDGVADTGIGAPLTDEQMKQQVSFASWDFDTIWMICEGQDYPHLQWEGIDCNQ